jgi:hypothetical protein
MALACLDTLVGLSKTEYACFADDVPDTFDTSDSGYHLTDTDYGLTVVEQCSLNGWTLLQSALDQAILETKTDLRAKIRERYDGRITPFRGQVGKLKHTAVLTSVTDTVIGVRIRVYNQVKGAKWVFKKVWLGLNSVITDDITITSNDPNFTEPTPFSITTVANQFASATTAIELPLWSYGEYDPGEYLEYYLTIPRGSAKPLNNNFACCGSTPQFRQYFEVAGMGANDEDATNAVYSTSAAYGFVLDGYMTCEELDWICELEELNGYHLLDVIARTIQFRGAAIAISGLVDTIQVNPCSGYQLENLNSRRGYLNKRYADNIAWIAENMPDGITDCFVCKPAQKFHKQKMVV